MFDSERKSRSNKKQTLHIYATIIETFYFILFCFILFYSLILSLSLARSLHYLSVDNRQHLYSFCTIRYKSSLDLSPDKLLSQRANGALAKYRRHWSSSQSSVHDKCAPLLFVSLALVCLSGTCLFARCNM